MLFDQTYYLEINNARWTAASKILSTLSDLQSCVEAGCDPGWFSERLSGMGLCVRVIDGRQELVEEAQRRAPTATISTVDVTSPEVTPVSQGRNETQGLNYLAVIPSRKSLVKERYIAGFKFVYRYTGAVDHPDFIDASNRLHRREIFVASKTSPLNVPDTVNEQAPPTPKIDYST